MINLKLKWSPTRTAVKVAVKKNGNLINENRTDADNNLSIDGIEIPILFNKIGDSVHIQLKASNAVAANYSTNVSSPKLLPEGITFVSPNTVSIIHKIYLKETF